MSNLTNRRSRLLEVVRAGVVIGLSGAGIGCGGAPGVPSGRGYSTPAPPAGVSATSSRTNLLAYATSLAYDTATMASDEQPLPLWNPGGLQVAAVNVRVEPERGAFRLTRLDLGNGRIIARYLADSTYSPLGIPGGTSYVWVDSVGGTFREVVIPEDPSLGVTILPSQYDPHPLAYLGPDPVYAARWVVSADTVRCQRPCSPFGCCRCTAYARSTVP